MIIPHTVPKWLPRLPGRLWRDREGASLLEFSVVLPFLLVLGLGVIEFGNALYQYHMVTAGVRDAGRYLGSVDKNLPGVPVTTNAKKIAVCGQITSCTDDDKRLPWWPEDIADIETAIAVQYCLNETPDGPDTIAGCDCQNLSLHNISSENYGQGSGSHKVCISTTATYGDFGFLSFLGLGQLTFTTGHEQRYYGIR